MDELTAVMAGGRNNFALCVLVIVYLLVMP